jgi:transposase-like protein
MPTQTHTLRDIHAQVEARLRELAPLVSEYEELNTIATAIDANGTSKPTGTHRGRRGGTGSSRKHTRRRRRGGPTRAQQVQDLVSQQPGITVSETARKLNVAPTGLYSVARRLATEGAIRKQGTGWIPVGKSPATPATPAAKPAPASAKSRPAKSRA